MKLSNACNLVFLIDNTYKTNRYRLSLLDIVGVTPTGITFSIAFAYFEGECLNNVVGALERFWGIFLIRDALPGVTVAGRDLALMSAAKTVFPDSTNLLCQFHIDKNMKAKCKTLVGKKKCMGSCHGSLGEFGGFSFWAKLWRMPYEIWNFFLLTTTNVCWLCQACE